jgi:hypothetical protein
MYKPEISNIEMKNTEDNVFYCEHCLSLKIIMIPKTINCYCGECGNTDIVETEINLWEELYIEEYGRRHLDGRKTDRKGISSKRG